MPCTPPVNDPDIAAFPIVFVQYWAKWNRYDREYEVLLAEVRKMFADKVAFRSCDVDEPTNRKYCDGLANIPAISLYVDGTRRALLVGMRKIEVVQILAKLQRNGSLDS